MISMVFRLFVPMVSQWFSNGFLCVSNGCRMLFRCFSINLQMIPNWFPMFFLTFPNIAQRLPDERWCNSYMHYPAPSKDAPQARRWRAAGAPAARLRRVLFL